MNPVLYRFDACIGDVRRRIEVGLARPERNHILSFSFQTRRTSRNGERRRRLDALNAPRN